MQRRALTEDVRSRKVAAGDDGRRLRSVAQALGLAGAMGIGFLAGFGCGADSDVTDDSTIAALRACGLDDGTIEHGARLHACDPGDVKKTTICHIPPGNPANAHTLCIGNAAVPAHLDNHGDSLGACQSERPCTPPPSTGSGGGPGADDDSGRGGSSAPQTGGAAGAAGSAVIIVG
jgi:hypothetical protein